MRNKLGVDHVRFFMSPTMTEPRRGGVEAIECSLCGHDNQLDHRDRVSISLQRLYTSYVVYWSGAHVGRADANYAF